jgi:hypothetical protein
VKESGVRIRESGGVGVDSDRIEVVGILLQIWNHKSIHHLPLITDLLITFWNEKLITPGVYSDRTPPGSWILPPDSST